MGSPTSFDAVLGGSEQRYLDHGYKGVRHFLSVRGGPPTVADVGGPEMSARVEYPQSWSTKPDGAMAPHLSTLDAMILGAGVAERRLRALRVDVSRCHLSRIGIRAAGSPIEDLSAVPVGYIDNFDHGDYECDVHLGGMRVSTSSRLEGAAKPPDHCAGPSDANIEEPEPIQFARRDIQSSILKLDLGERRLLSTHIALSLTTDARTSILSVRGHWATYVDFLRIAAQAAQVLIYSVDGVTRSASRNLWMRTATFSHDPRLPHVSGTSELATSITKCRTINRGCEAWRVFDASFLLDRSFLCQGSLAYRP
ncbi:AvrD family protein [Micropruina sp.]|uniref:AvrD family protein n=1 Tax=Micropruina sp. TaxID=2737536 RepID=UPI0039E2C8BF